MDDSLPTRVLRLERRLRAVSGALVCAFALLLVGWVTPDRPDEDVVEALEFRVISEDGQMLGFITARDGFPQMILTASDGSAVTAINAGDVILDTDDGEIVIGHTDKGPHLFMLATEDQPRLALRADQEGANVELRGSGGSMYFAEANRTFGSLQFRGPNDAHWASIITEASGQKLTMSDKEGVRHAVFGFMDEGAGDVPVNFLMNEDGKVVWDGYGTIPDSDENRDAKSSGGD
jgi:hypothetical protein